MSNQPLDHTQARSIELEDGAKKIGVSEAYIDLLVETFYTRIRTDETLGPIFDEAIKDNWPFHLGRMKTFWGAVALRAGGYSGKPVPVHRALKGVWPWYFTQWLALFRSTLQDTAPNQAVIDHFMLRAERIARSLKLAMFGVGQPPTQ